MQLTSRDYLETTMDYLNEMDGEGEALATMDEENNIEPFLTFLPPYILCNSTNYTKLPLCNNKTDVVSGCCVAKSMTGWVSSC